MMRAADAQRAFAAFPFAELDAIIGSGVPLILAPHADDESLGCGGLIAACCRRGTPPLVVFLTDGTGSHPGSRAYPPGRLRDLRENEARTALQILGGGTAVFLRLPDTAAPTSGPAFDTAVETLLRLASDTGSTTLLAPWRHDPHCDHEAADLMARAVAARGRIRHLSYPVWGWLLPPEHELPEAEFSGCRLDITHDLATKRAAIAAHASQYSDLISDDPAGFRLPLALLEVFERPTEVYLRP